MRNIFALAIVFCSLSAMAADRSLVKTGEVVKSFNVTCGTSPTAIVGTAGDIYTSLICTQLDVVEVYIGASDVTTGTGFPVCNDRSLCGVSVISLSANNAYCRVAAATETLKCLAVVR